MESSHPFEKRIKRHVIGPKQTFFVAIAPGLAPLCLEELREPPLGISHAEVTEGGVVFKGRLPDCYKANLHLRTASRILMRMDRFRATEFHTLERKIRNFPWELYLWPNTPVKLRVTCRQSRLYHSRAVRERFEAGIRHRLAHAFTRSDTDHTPERAPATVFIRAVSDTFHISIDSSGALLFKRGVKSHPSHAPIRETLAAGVLIQAGYRTDRPLMDPMCGSGTFTLEAAMMAGSVPAGWYRNFAFVHWPAFRPGQWRHIRREARNDINVQQGAAIYACDQEEPSVRALQNCVARHGFDAIVRVERADFFNLSPRQIGAIEGLVVLNPPYGRRMGATGQPLERYAAICDKLIHDFKQWRFAIIAPPRAMPRGFSAIRSTHRLFHGGLKLLLHIGRIPG